MRTYNDVVAFISKVQDQIGELKKLLKELDDGSITPEECISRAKMMDESLENEARRFNLSSEEKGMIN
jgi:predicted methyltransferase